MQPVASELRRRLADLEGRAADFRGRAAERDACAVRAAEIEAEIAATRARLEERGAASWPRSALDDLRIASPCTASWVDMVGDDRVRHCAVCRKNVFDLSAMTKREAERVLAEHESPCVRLFVRRDGTTMTADCPVGRRRLRLRRVVAVTGTAGVLAALALVATAPGFPHTAISGLRVAQRAADKAGTEALQPSWRGDHVMGGLAR